MEILRSSGSQIAGYVRLRGMIRTWVVGFNFAGTHGRLGRHSP